MSALHSTLLKFLLVLPEVITYNILTDSVLFSGIFLRVLGVVIDLIQIQILDEYEEK